VAVISNFTPVARENHFVPLPTAGKWREVLNSDAKDYGGSGVGNNGMVDATVNKDGKISAEMVLPPLSTIMLELVEEAPAARVEKKAAKPVAKKRSSSRKKAVAEAAA
jgi:1,4-alpha-glucan branching enzyme